MDLSGNESRSSMSWIESGLQVHGQTGPWDRKSPETNLNTGCGKNTVMTDGNTNINSRTHSCKPTSAPPPPHMGTPRGNEGRSDQQGNKWHWYT